MNKSIDLKFKDKVVILVEFFLKKETVIGLTSKDWARERFAAKKLFLKYNDFHFFYTLNHLYGKFNSLLGLYSNKYEDIQKLYDNFLIEKSKKIEYTLSSESVIKIEEVKRKAKNVMEFLDN